MDRFEKSRLNKREVYISKGNKNKTSKLLVSKMFKPRKGWNKKFKTYVKEGEDELLIPDFFEDEILDETDYLNKDTKLKHSLEQLKNGETVSKTLKDLGIN